MPKRRKAATAAKTEESGTEALYACYAKLAGSSAPPAALEAFLRALADNLAAGLQVAAESGMGEALFEDLPYRIPSELDLMTYNDRKRCVPEAAVRCIEEEVKALFYPAMRAFHPSFADLCIASEDE